MSESVIVAGARTPIGKFLGAFSSLSAVDLGGAAIAEALQRSAVDPASVDFMIHDGLWCAFDHCHMGESTDAVNATLGIGRTEQDEWAARSHERAAEATKEGRLGAEIIPIDTPGRKGDGNRVETDEGIRPGMTAESIAKMRPAFTREGTITAANASQI